MCKDLIMKTAEHIMKMNDFMVHFQADPAFDHIVYFQAYPVNECFRPNGETEFMYIDKENEPNPLDVFDKNKALCKFTGSYCWRGCWEGRLYFKDDEYWSEDLSEMHELFTKHIEPFSKYYLKSMNPNAKDE